MIWHILKLKTQEIWNFRLKSSKKLGKFGKITYNLRPNFNNFEINKVYISTFLKTLWNYPEAVYFIIKSSDNDVVEKVLANFCDE